MHHNVRKGPDYYGHTSIADYRVYLNIGGLTDAIVC